MRRAAPEMAAAAAGPVSASAVPAAAVAQGRARFRERFEAHRQQRAENETAARALVGRWDELAAGFSAALPKLDADPAYGVTREALLGFGREARAQPGAVGVLRQQGDAFGLGERPNLGRVLADAQPEQVVGGIVKAAEARMRVQLQERAAQQAVQQAAQEAARRQAVAEQERYSQRSGPSVRM